MKRTVTFTFDMISLMSVKSKNMIGCLLHLIRSAKESKKDLFEMIESLKFGYEVGARFARIPRAYPRAG